jgi:hypothetical protein
VPHNTIGQPQQPERLLLHNGAIKENAGVCFGATV